MIDTDNFKQINDTLGHIAGDMVLGEMATAMKKKVRDSDVVGRIGGDEFIIFMKNITSHLDAEKKAEELQKTFAHLFDKEKSKIQVTSSIGIALYPKDGHNFWNCMQMLIKPFTKPKSKARIHISYIMKNLVISKVLPHILH